MKDKSDKTTTPEKQEPKAAREEREDRTVIGDVNIHCPNNRGTVIGRIDGDFSI